MDRQLLFLEPDQLEPYKVSIQLLSSVLRDADPGDLWGGKCAVIACILSDWSLFYYGLRSYKWMNRVFGPIVRGPIRDC